MGILQNVREKLGSKVTEIKQKRERDKTEFNEHYNREYEIARANEIKKSAEAKAKSDAYDRVHPLESISKKLSGFGGNMGHETRGTPNRLGRNLSGLGDFGRSIGHQYDQPGNHLPSALRDFDRPRKKRF